jgi:indole-3-glycerol phosphate synthase
MQRAALVAEKRQEIQRLTGMSLKEVVPSRRDFTQFLATRRKEIALVPRLKRADPWTGAAWPSLDVLARARAYDDTGAAAIAVATAACCGGSLSDLRVVAAAVTAPVLRDDLCLDRRQLYDARLHGADAVVLPARELADAEVVTLAGIARSMHMAPVIEIFAAPELETAAALRGACLGLRCPARDGFVDPVTAKALAERIPPSCIVLLLDEVRELAELRHFTGLIDAAVVGDALLSSECAAAEIEAFLDAGA